MEGFDRSKMVVVKTHPSPEHHRPSGGTRSTSGLRGWCSCWWFLTDQHWSPGSQTSSRTVQPVSNQQRQASCPSIRPR